MLALPQPQRLVLEQEEDALQVPAHDDQSLMSNKQQAHSTIMGKAVKP